MTQPCLNLQLLAGTLAIGRLAPEDAVPAWAFSAGALCSVTRTTDELSIVCSESSIPVGLRCEKGWRAFKVKGPLDFGLTGILDALTQPLAKAGISIFAVSTFDTDYLLVREAHLEETIEALRAAGHSLGTA